MTTWSSFATGSRRPTASRVTCDARSRRHPAQDRDRLLPGHPAPPRPSGPRSAHPHQRPHPQGPEEDRGRQEEGRQEVVPGHVSADRSPQEKQMPPEPHAGAKKVRRKEKKNVAHGHAHIKSTFNNTIVSITDPMGNVVAGLSAGQVGLQGLAQVHAVRGADGRRGRRPPRPGARHAQGRRVREGPGSGRETAIRSLQATGLEVGTISDVTPGRTTAAARRSAGGSDARDLTKHGPIYRPGLQALPSREDEALPQGHQVRVAEVPDRDPSLPAG